MKRLIFIRHGKAEDNSTEISDIKRSLTPKGKVVSMHMARKMVEKEKSPGIIITSPAFRALETAIIFAWEYGIDVSKVILNPLIYANMNIQTLPGVLSGISEETETVTMFGHNPSFTQLVNTLSKEGCDTIPKNGIVCISFGIITWSEIGHNTGKIEYFLKP
jgi:phosphohistidine phosphatase